MAGNEEDGREERAVYWNISFLDKVYLAPICSVSPVNILKGKFALTELSFSLLVTTS